MQKKGLFPFVTTRVISGPAECILVDLQNIIIKLYDLQKRQGEVYHPFLT